MFKKIQKNIIFLFIFTFISVNFGKNEKGIMFNFSSVEYLRAENIYHPKPGVSWYWQLKGKVKTDLKVELYDIDLFDNSNKIIKNLKQKNYKVICYFSAGSFEDWRIDAKDFKKNDIGKKMDGWDEKWLDIRSKNIWKIMKKRIELAAAKGCDGVEPDNVDGYDNDSGFDLNFNDQLRFNRFLAKTAHKNNLSVALKNDLNQASVLVNDFDFALNEECFQYNECKKLLPFIKNNKAVLNVEYKKNKEFQEKKCHQSKKWNFSTLFLPDELDGTFKFSCNNELSNSNSEKNNSLTANKDHVFGDKVEKSLEKKRSDRTKYSNVVLKSSVSKLTIEEKEALKTKIKSQIELIKKRIQEIVDQILNGINYKKDIFGNSTRSNKTSKTS